MLAGGRVEIDIFGPNSYRVHLLMAGPWFRLRTTALTLRTGLALAAVLRSLPVWFKDSPEERKVRNYFLAAFVVFSSSSFFFTLSISSCSLDSWIALVHSFRASSYRLVL